MTDPSSALQSFQEMLLRGQIQLVRGELDPDLHLHADNPNGHSRLTYVRLDGSTIAAFVEFIWRHPIEGTPCLQVGYAVPEGYRNRGLATEVLRVAILEMQHGLARQERRDFYVEAVVGADNKTSQRVAAKVISDAPVAVTDGVSGQPALKYTRRVSLNPFLNSLEPERKPHKEVRNALPV